MVYRRGMISGELAGYYESEDCMKFWRASNTPMAGMSFGDVLLLRFKTELGNIEYQLGELDQEMGVCVVSNDNVVPIKDYAEWNKMIWEAWAFIPGNDE